MDTPIEYEIESTADLPILPIPNLMTTHRRSDPTYRANYEDIDDSIKWENHGNEVQQHNKENHSRWISLDWDERNVLEIHSINDMTLQIPECTRHGIHRNNTANAIRGNVLYIRFTPKNEFMQHSDFFEVASFLIDEVNDTVNEQNETWKIHPVLNIRLIKFDSEGKVLQRETFLFSLPAMRSEEFHLANVSHQLNLQIEEFLTKGSGWVMEGVNYFDLRLTRYHTIQHVAGRAANIPLPPKLASKKAVVNVRNAGVDCFRYALLSVLHYNDIVKHRDRPAKYKSWLNEHNWEGIQFPMTAGQLSKFERHNPDLTINLMEWRGEKDEMNPVHLIRAAPKSIKPPINILCVPMKDGQYHYVGVTNLNRLLNSRYTSHDRKYCPWCLKPLFHKKAYDEHLPCQGDQTSVKMSDKKVIQFENFAKTQELSYVMYADCECYLSQVSSQSEVKHVPCAIGLLLVPHPDLNQPLQIPYKQFVGEDCIERALIFIEETVTAVYHWNENHTRVPLQIMTQSEWNNFYTTNQCDCCQSIFDKDKMKKVRDHCHLTGKYRGAICSKCNLKIRMSRRKLPVFFHNFRNYDAHLLCTTGIGYQKHWDITVIPQTKEKYLMMSMKYKVESESVTDDENENSNNIMRIEFKDSAQFMQASLDKLVRNLGSSQLNYTKMAFPNGDIQAKGIFPYEWFDSMDKLKASLLPPIEDFYDHLNKKACSPEDYKKAQETWSQLNCQTFKDYMLHYLRLDVHQLTDVFETFRRISMTEDGLDPAHYPTIPSLTWDSAFKMTSASCEVIQDRDMYEMIESGIRGGMTFVNQHHVKANAPFLPDYDLAQPRIEMAYIDANNLYGHALSMSLPQSHFEWVEDCEQLKRDFLSLDLTKDTGYLIECDLIYPHNIHDKTIDLPFCPEKKKIIFDDLSDFMRKQLEHLSLKYSPMEKLMLTQFNKTKYVIHGRLLQFFLKHGMILEKVHRAIKFFQSSYFEPYISYNSKKRQLAKNSFEKDFYKLKNNSLYGKTVENVKKRMNFKLVNNEEKLLSYSSKPHFLSSLIFHDDLVGVHFTKEQVILEKPIYIGQAVLDLSKLIMYELFYDKLKSYEVSYPNASIQIIGGDTDSLFMKITNIDLYGDLFPRMLQDELLDTSNYPPDHPLFTNEHKAKLGFVKDEAEGNHHLEWILLRPKAYSMKLINGEDIRRAKGVRQVVVKKTINHDDYMKTYLNQSTLSCEQMRIASRLHQISTYTYTKKSLSIFEDKRFWISRNDSVPYGYYGLKQPSLLQNVNQNQVDCQYVANGLTKMETDDGKPIPSQKRNAADDDNSDSFNDEETEFFLPARKVKKRKIYEYFDLETTI